MPGIKNRDGWLGLIFYPAPPSINWKCGRQKHLILLTIDKELGWAAAIGMNVMRVYLHDLAWKADAAGFKQRMDEFLTIANKTKIKILFTIFDDCWNPDAAIGKQPEPRPGSTQQRMGS